MNKKVGTEEEVEEVEEEEVWKCEIRWQDPKKKK
jgi:hypothetical protein